MSTNTNRRRRSEVWDWLDSIFALVGALLAMWFLILGIRDHDAYYVSLSVLMVVLVESGRTDRA